MIKKRITIDFDNENQYKEFKTKMNYLKTMTYITNNGNVIKYCIDSKYDNEKEENTRKINKI
ncbi:hypothetical protein ELUMI_v1c06640 [Williamsoniiplasma luminosum]|uniref:Uncharacterized protein n=1 Tax=Williamsoniiplasma luminosum TaxID=214888 RepID=A0A2K8NV19_9MOLU|nr:hypothetical protein [Williamsoniiplasma luminosum]ATZ17386.1 hypothetical protein ELUMI_v1c06640 [Williamsoniiplasma luminosum]